MEYLSFEQVTQILQAAHDRSRRDHLMLLLSFSHGLRRSEVANLRIRDVLDGQIRVARVKGSLETTSPLIASPNVLFDEPAALAAWLAERPTKTDALFPSCRKIGSPLNGHQVWHITLRYMRLAGIPAKLAHHHSLRHACCSLQARNGVGIEYIAQHVGHKDIKNTRIYLHITGSEAAQKAQEVFQRLAR